MLVGVCRHLGLGGSWRVPGIPSAGRPGTRAMTFHAWAELDSVSTVVCPPCSDRACTKFAQNMCWKCNFYVCGSHHSTYFSAQCSYSCGDSSVSLTEEVTSPAQEIGRAHV